MRTDPEATQFLEKEYINGIFVAVLPALPANINKTSTCHKEKKDQFKGDSHYGCVS
jgi:hypothetical protein